MISKFLPTDFDKSAKIAILAGKGAMVYCVTIVSSFVESGT